jgi:hypothetical protein
MTETAVFPAGRPRAMTVLWGLAGLASLAGCSDAPSSDGNPRVLWLASQGADETRVQLVESEPGMF